MAQNQSTGGKSSRPPTRSQQVGEGTSGAVRLNTSSADAILEGGHHLTSADFNEMQDRSMQEAGQQPTNHPDPNGDGADSGGVGNDAVAGGDQEEEDGNDENVDTQTTAAAAPTAPAANPPIPQPVPQVPAAPAIIPTQQVVPAPQIAARPFGPRTAADWARRGSRPAAVHIITTAGQGLPPLPNTPTFRRVTVNVYLHLVNFWHLGHGAWTLGLPPTGPGHPNRSRTGVVGPDAAAWIARHRHLPPR